MTEQNSRPEFFISYSRIDANLVGPVVALLRASRAHVFRDADSLQPGKKWREQLSTAITDAKIVVLFWCHHADQSVEVRNEYSEALSKGKDLLPLLLDDTPLPDTLAEYQFIDFRGAFPHGHAESGDGITGVSRSSPMPRASAPRRRSTWITAIAASVVLVIGYFMIAPNLLMNMPAGAGSGGPLQGALPPADTGGPSLLPWVIGGAALLLVLLLWQRRRRRKALAAQRTDTAAAAPAQIPQAHAIASSIEDELRRRLANL